MSKHSPIIAANIQELLPPYNELQLEYEERSKVLNTFLYESTLNNES